MKKDDKKDNSLALRPFDVSEPVIAGVLQTGSEVNVWTSKHKQPSGQILIRTIDGEAEAHRLLTKFQDYGDAIALERDAALRPLLDEEKKIREKAKVHLVAIGSAMDTLEAAIKENKKWKDDEARKAQELINAQAEKDRQKEEKRAAKKGEEPRPLPPAQLVEEAPKSVVVDDRKRTFVDHWVFRITGTKAGDKLTAAHPALVEFVKRHPELFLLDEKTLGATIRAGKGTNPYGAPIDVFNDEVLSTKKAF
jgi:hypothetical protein